MRAPGVFARPVVWIAAAILGGTAQAQAVDEVPWRHAHINEVAELLGLPPELPISDLEAQPAGGSLGLQDSIRRGAEVSFDAQAAAEHSKSVDYTRRAALGALLPRIDVSAGAGRGELTSLDPYLTTTRSEASITLRQVVLDYAAKRELDRQSQLSKAARWQQQGANSAAGLEAASAYLQALQSRMVIALSEEHEGRLQELLGYITRRAEAGGTSEAEAARVRARVANARATIADSRANLRTALRNLESLLQETPAALTIGTPARLLPIPGTVTEAKQLAETSNFDLLAAQADKDAADRETGGYVARFVPRVELLVQHRIDENGAGTVSELRDSRVMLQATLSLLNGGADRAQYSASAHRAREKTLQRDSSRRRLAQELDSAYATLDGMAERFGAVREEMAANATVVEAFREQLVGGNRQLLDVLDAYQRYHQSRLDIAQLSILDLQNHVKVAHLIGVLAPMLGVP
ncbi:MAG: TolC family protein [Steroidobacteraceae bacterium]